jgi:hypothetical protein
MKVAVSEFVNISAGLFFDFMMIIQDTEKSEIRSTSHPLKTTATKMPPVCGLLIQIDLMVQYLITISIRDFLAGTRYL